MCKGVAARSDDRRTPEGLSMTSGRSLDDLHDLVDEVRDIIGRCPGGLRETSGRSSAMSGRSLETSGTSSMRSRKSWDDLWNLIDGHRSLIGEVQSIKSTKTLPLRRRRTLKN